MTVVGPGLRIETGSRLSVIFGFVELWPDLSTNSLSMFKKPGHYSEGASFLCQYCSSSSTWHGICISCSSRNTVLCEDTLRLRVVVNS